MLQNHKSDLLLACYIQQLMILKLNTTQYKILHSINNYL